MSKHNLKNRGQQQFNHKDVYYPFTLRTVEKKSNEKESEEYDCYESFHFGMINGKNCLAIADTCEIWFEDFKEWIKSNNSIKYDVNDKIFEFWKLLKKVFTMFNYTNEQIENLKKNDFEEERKFFIKLGNTFLEAFGKAAKKIQYLHIIVCHTIAVSYNFNN